MVYTVYLQKKRLVDNPLSQVGDACLFVSPEDEPPYVGTVERIFTSRYNPKPCIRPSPVNTFVYPSI
jgi:hypothetical protein